MADPKLTLERYAAVTAELGEGDRPRREVLERHGISEDEFAAVERDWLERMADDVRENGASCTLPLVYSEALSRAREALAPTPDLTPEQWAEIAIETERAGGPGDALAARALSLADYFRLVTHFARLLSSDDAARERYLAAVSRLRESAEREPSEA